jgi:hypothetical protein
MGELRDDIGAFEYNNFKLGFEIIILNEVVESQAFTSCYNTSHLWLFDIN